MPSSYTSLLYHIVFSTKERRPLITPDLQTRLYEYIGGIVTHENSLLRSVGGMNDHIHLLINIPSTKALSDFLRIIKSNSSKWIHETFPQHRTFGWQDGYGAFTVSKSALLDVQAYIETQPEHHKRFTFQEEFIEFLRRHEIQYDERYLWS